MKPTLLVVIVALALTGCAAAPADAPPALSKADYFSLVRENVPGLSTATDETLTTLGTNTCVIMRGDGDHPWVTAVKAMIDGGLSGKDSGAAITFAVSTYCPEVKGLLGK